MASLANIIDEDNDRFHEEPHCERKFSIPAQSGEASHSISSDLSD